MCVCLYTYPVVTKPVFTKHIDVLLTARACEVSKPRDLNLHFSNHPEISQTSWQHKFQSDTIIIPSNLVALRLHEIWL